MSSETARKVVVAAALVGTVAIVYSGASAGKPAATTYKRVWGLLLLVIGGSVLADFAPQVVGPYLLLALLGFALHNRSGLGSLVGQASQAASNTGGGAG